MFSNLAYCQCELRQISLQAEELFLFSSLHVNNGKPRFVRVSAFSSFFASIGIG